jgi:hypothetical protein
MNCEEVKEELAEFLDGTLDIERAREIENHFSACSRCNAESESLADCKRLVSSLPVVEPPAGFTTRVMAQVHDVVHRPSIWQRLFLPLRIKIPLQATAVVLIGILSIYVYQRENGYESPAPTISRDRLSAGKSEFTQAPTAIEKKNESGASPGPRASVQEPAKPASPAAPRTSAAEVPQSSLKDKKEQSDSAAPYSPGTSEERKTPPAEEAGTAPSSLESLRQERTGTAGPSADRASSSQDQPAPDYELVVRLRSPERRDQAPADPTDVLGKSAEKDKLLQGRRGSIAGETAASPSTPPLARTVWYSVPQNRYEEFKKNLAAQGTIEFETAASTKEKETARKPEDLLSIKVTIMPPR